MNFLAIDFETANYYRNSACALGLVKVSDNLIVQRTSVLIKPPQNWFVFSYLQGIVWDDVKKEPTFAELWDQINNHFKDIDFVVAHNAMFDRSVLIKSCEFYGLDIPESPFLCTVKISRMMWNIFPTTLSDVCRQFSIPLKHHDALSDTEACAQIMIRAIEHGYNYEP